MTPFSLTFESRRAGEKKRIPGCRRANSLRRIWILDKYESTGGVARARSGGRGETTTAPATRRCDAGSRAAKASSSAPSNDDCSARDTPNRIFGSRSLSRLLLEEATDFLFVSGNRVSKLLMLLSINSMNGPLFLIIISHDVWKPSIVVYWFKWNNVKLQWMNSEKYGFISCIMTIEFSQIIAFGKFIFIRFYIELFL